MDLPSRVAGPGQERPLAGDCDAWRPRPRRVGPSACRVADGRAGGRANSRLRGGDASGATRAAGCQVGRVTRPMMRRSRGFLAAAVPAGRRSLGLAMMHPMQLAALGCIAMPAGAMMMQAAQRNQLHHRCIRSSRTVKSKVTAAARWPGRPEGTARPHAATQAARVHVTCRMMHQMQFCPFAALKRMRAAGCAAGILRESRPASPHSGILPERSHTQHRDGHCLGIVDLRAGP
jgi:hypothetical protein